MPSALLAVWPLYLVGSVVVLLGFLALHTWIRGVMGRGPDQPGSILAASAIAFLVGAATIAIGIGIDQATTTNENLRQLLYHVEVDLTGPGPVQFLLPAPGEPSLFHALNVTNGTSTMRTVVSGTDVSLLLTATGDVSFDVRAQVVTPVFNGSFTHVALIPGAVVSNANVTIEMTADGTNGTSANLVLQIQVVESCHAETLVLQATTHEGRMEYPGTLTNAVC